MGTVYNFNYFQFVVVPFNLFSSFCKNWSTGFRCFGLFEGAQNMFLFSKCFCSRVSLSRCWAFCPLLCLFEKSKLLIAHYQTLGRSWQQFFYPVDTWRVYRDSPRVDKWKKLDPVSVAIFQRCQSIKCEIYNWKKHNSALWWAMQ